VNSVKVFRISGGKWDKNVIFVTIISWVFW